MKKIIIVISFFFLSDNLFAQSSEIGIILGGMSYKGDLNQSLFNTKMFHLAAGLLYRHSYNNHWSFKAGLNYGSISASDAQSDNAFQLYRNLSFRTNILEITGQYEFNFFPFQTANEDSYWTPYIFIGLAVFHFNPEAELGDTWYELQPLGTEGQGSSAYPSRSKYNRIVVSLPFGGGLKFRLNERWGLGIEVGPRRTYTDYLDDVSTTYADKTILAHNGPLAVILSDRSPAQATNANVNRQRGSTADNDWYMFVGVMLNYTLSKRYNEKCKPFKSKLN